MKKHLLGLLPVAALAWTGCAMVPGMTAVPPTVSAEASSTPVPPPTVTQSQFAGCYFVWSSQDLPELSQVFAASLKALGPEVTGGAYAFGEDCVFADGSHTFTAMETDFRAKVAVADLTDEDALGNWMTKVMRNIEALPAAYLPGSRVGKLDLEFYTAGGGSLTLSIDIVRYRSTAPAIVGAQLFRLFYRAP